MIKSKLSDANLLIILLVLAYVLPGLVGHDPWKQDEAYVFDIIWHMVQSNDPVVPTLAGEPFMEKPPLYYYAAALDVRAFSGWLPPHDAARLTSGLFMLITLLCVWLTGRELEGAARGRMAVLLVLGSPGLVYPAHLMVTDVALLSGFAIGLYGLALARRNWWWGGVWLGMGVGMGFLAKGLMAPGVLGITALLLPLVAQDWRCRGYATTLLVASLVALPWLLIWPHALYQRSPDLFKVWFWDNNFGRYLGFAHLGAERTDRAIYLETLLWQSWPMWLLALGSLWQGWRDRLTSGSMRLLLLLLAVLLVVLNGAMVWRDLYSLPALLPLALIAALVGEHLPGWLDRWLTTVSILLFAALAVVIWGVWLYMAHYGTPPDLPELASQLPLDFQPSFAVSPFIVALALTLAWLVALWKLRAIPWRAVGAWTLGVTLIWGLLTTLWLPWIDAAKSYRGMITDLKYALPPHYTCIASLHVGECERGMLDYLTGIVTRRFEQKPDADCDLLLVREKSRTVVARLLDLAPGWHSIWVGGRSDNPGERYILFQRETVN